MGGGLFTDHDSSVRIKIDRKKRRKKKIDVGRACTREPIESQTRKRRGALHRSIAPREKKKEKRGVRYAFRGYKGGGVGVV